MKSIQQSFADIVKGIEQDHIGLFMATEDGATCSIVHHGDKSNREDCARALLRVALQNYLSVMEGDDFAYADAACCAESAIEEMLDEYKADNGLKDGWEE